MQGAKRLVSWIGCFETVGIIWDTLTSRATPDLRQADIVTKTDVATPSKALQGPVSPLRKKQSYHDPIRLVAVIDAETSGQAPVEPVPLANRCTSVSRRAPTLPTMNPAWPFLLMILVLLSGSAGCRRDASSSRDSLEKVTLAVATQSISAPIYVAYEKGFFKEEGLEVSLQSFLTGREAFFSVLKGKAQFATVAETPLMFAGCKGDKFSIIATIADSNKYQKIVARKDRGVAGVQDLIGKKVGVCPGTSAEYYLDALLTYYKIAENWLDIVPVKPEDMTVALKNGAIDAVVSWPPHLANQQKILGNNAVTIENEAVYTIYWNIAADPGFTKTHPETVRKLLRALVRAEQFIAFNAGDVRQMVGKKIGSEDFTLADYNFDLYLGQNLLLAMEDEARWAIEERLSDLREVPNFLPLFYPDGVRAVAPSAVTLTTGREP